MFIVVKGLIVEKANIEPSLKTCHAKYEKIFSTGMHAWDLVIAWY